MRIARFLIAPALLLAAGCSVHRGLVDWTSRIRAAGGVGGVVIAADAARAAGVKPGDLSALDKILATASRLVRGILGSARFQDLADCFRVSIGFGPGLMAEARVGMITNPALGSAAHTFRFGLENRTIAGWWDSQETPFPTNLLFPATTPTGARRYTSESASPTTRLGLTTSSPHSLAEGLLMESYRRTDVKSIKINDRMTRIKRSKRLGYWHPLHSWPKKEKDKWFNRITEVEAGATVAVISARVSVNPLEVLDFVLGFLGADIAGDDPSLKVTRYYHSGVKAKRVKGQKQGIRRTSGEARDQAGRLKVKVRKGAQSFK